MGLSEIYGRSGNTYNVETALYRFGIISKVWGVPCKYGVKVLTSDNRNMLSSLPMTETLERLLFLYGAGIIDFTVFTKLTAKDMVKVEMTDVIADAEKFLLKQYKDYGDVRFSNDMISQIILCCATARMHFPEEHLTFSDAKYLCSLPTVKIVDNFVKVTGKKLLELMVKNKEKFGTYTITDDNTVITPEYYDNILGNEDVQKGNYAGSGYPISLAPSRVLFYDRIEKLLYGEEFLEYCVTYGHVLDDNYLEEYHRYMERIKCKFTIRAYHRRRNVCGNIYNNFDYCSNINNTAVEPEGEDVIELTPTCHMSIKELDLAAMMKYCEKHEVRNESVLELHNQGKIRLYAFHDSQFIEINNETFRNTLFDYGKLWGTIQNYSTAHGIEVHDGQVEIPVELMRKFTEEEQPFAEALIREQYARQLDQNDRKVISTLSELIASASEDKKKDEQIKKYQADEKAKQKQELDENMSKRKSATEGVT